MEYNAGMGKKAKAIDPLATVRVKPASVKRLMLNPAASRNQGKGLYDPLPTFPDEILACTNLEELEIFRGVLRGPIPKKLGTLKKLKRLTLGGIDFDTLPDEIGNLVNLEELALDYTESLTALPATIGKLTKLRELSAAYSGIATLPPAIGKLANLEIARLGIAATSVPKELWKLSKLKHLSLPDHVQTLPPGIGALTALTDLSLSASALASIAKELPKLTSLTNLWVTGKTTTLPPEVAQLPKLRTLQASYCELEAFPDVPGFPALAKLDLAGNKLTTALPLLARLRKLVELDIADNPIPTAERRQLDKLMKLTPAKRAAQLETIEVPDEAVPKPAKSTTPQQIGKIASINASLTLVIGDANVVAAWKGIGGGDLEDSDWQRSINAIKKKDFATIDIGSKPGVVIAGIGCGIAYAYAVGERIVVVESFVEDEDEDGKLDELYLEWIASPPVKPRSIANLATPSGQLAFVSSTDSGDLSDGGFALATAKKVAISIEPQAKASWGEGRRIFIAPA